MDNNREPDVSSGATTNPFTSRELSQRLQRFHRVPSHSYGHPPSEATNAFDSHELQRRLDDKIEAPAPAEASHAPFSLANLNIDALNTYDSDPNVRVILYPSQIPALVVKVTPLGSIATNQSPSTTSGPHPNSLPVIQSLLTVGFHVQADYNAIQTAKPRQMTPLADLLDINLYCDPAADRMVIVNNHPDAVMVKRVQRPLDATSEDVAEELGTGLAYNTPEFLDAGFWAVFAGAEEQHILVLHVLPRRYVTVTMAGVVTEAGDTAPGHGSKRRREESQPLQALIPAKKGRLLDAVISDSGAAVVFHAAPPAGDNSSSVIVFGHPLEQLGPGDTAQVTGSVGDYTLVYREKIMVMTNSLVFKGEHSDVPGTVAVKLVRTGPAALSQQSASRIVSASLMWWREFKNHSKLCEHTSVVRLYPPASDSRLLSLVMEYIDAPTLASYRHTAPTTTTTPPQGHCTLALPQASRILADMTQALSYIHSRGVVHNDIKPGNILFSPARGAVLIDFGLSTDISDKMVHTGGSPWYIPYEYVEDGRRGVPGDVFALGVVMLFVLGGIRLPEMGAGRLNWRIADVRRKTKTGE
ncbi:CAMK protein kinase, partial [Coniochaeta hoffmannii]